MCDYVKYLFWSFQSARVISCQHIIRGVSKHDRNTVHADMLIEKHDFMTQNEPAHEIMARFVLRKLILQARIRSYPVALAVWFFTLRLLPYFMCARMRRLAWAFAGRYMISIIISRAGSNGEQVYDIMSIEPTSIPGTEMIVELAKNKIDATVHWSCTVFSMKKSVPKP